MRLLFIGDIVGKPGRHICKQALRGLRAEEKLDVIIANAENAAAGSGITPELYHELLAAGIDGITLGDHAFRRREIFTVLQTDRKIVRAANYPAAAPGRDCAILHTRQYGNVAFFTLLGRVFMPPIDSPFDAADRVLVALPPDVHIILVDFHAEATSDKQLMGRHLDGRVSAVLGTHTHVPTADERILPGGTAFQCDVGMTGPHESILGREISRVMETTRTFRPTHYDVAAGDVCLNGSIVDVDPETGHATAIRRICIDEATAKSLESRGSEKSK
jgi:metallophosphoesterase (TIGR00282 family)